MDNQIHNQIVSFIWGIADDCLRDVYVRGKYRDVILPMTVVRRLDAMLEDTKTSVLDMKKQLDVAGIDNQWPALCNVAGQAFCNASPFRLKDLTSRAKKQTLQKDFEAYLDGFSPNVQEILTKFKFRDQIPTMIDADILGAVIEKFVSPDINLSPKPIYKDEAQTILKHPGLDNHGMGTIFEELIRKFNEENNEEAGEHWTPRDVVELMADLIFMPIADQINDATYSCYDGACGTGGMLTVAQDRLLSLATQRGMAIKTSSLSTLPSWKPKSAPKNRPETQKIPLHENLRFECVASIGVVMPLPGKRRTATCSATRLCPLRGTPLSPAKKYRHALRQFRQISSRMTKFSAPVSSWF